jgi:hypothetical protein
MQVIGHTLAMAVEHRRNSFSPRSGVVFFDVSNPEAPQVRSLFSTELEMGDMGTGMVGVTPLRNGLYLMVVTAAHNETFFFYRSTTSDLGSSTLSWLPVGRIPGPDVENAHQCLNFLRQGDVDGPLYLAGARGRLASNNNRIDLYRVTSDTPDFSPGEQVYLTPVVSDRLIEAHHNLGGDEIANLAAASGFYVSPSGELIFYATEHDNDGPSDGTHGTVKMGEWRDVDVVRAGSPTLLPTARVNGPFEVDEGSAVNLTGTAGPPITKAWIQPFGAYDLDELEAGYTIVDFDDYGRDDFDDFFAIGGNFFADHIRSWNWYAPVGCSILAIDHENGTIKETKTLIGTGRVRHDLDLRLVASDGGGDNVNDKIDAVAFPRRLLSVLHHTVPSAMGPRPEHHLRDDGK